MTATAGGNDGDVVGLTTAGITEFTVTQAQKVKGDEILKKLVALHGRASTQRKPESDLRIVDDRRQQRSLDVAQFTQRQSRTRPLRQFLRNNPASTGLRVKGEIEENTANGDFGAFVGLAQWASTGAGIAIGAWDSGSLIVDPYSSARSMVAWN